MLLRFGNGHNSVATDGGLCSQWTTITHHEELEQELCKQFMKSLCRRFDKARCRVVQIATDSCHFVKKCESYCSVS